MGNPFSIPGEFTLKNVLGIADEIGLDNDTLHSMQQGYKQAQTGNVNYADVLSKADSIQKEIAEQQIKNQQKADKLNKKMERYSLIGNILQGVGALANTINTSYMAAAHGKRAAQIGTPFVDFGSSLAKQGLGYGEEAREYGRWAERSPAEMLGVLKTQADIQHMPFEDELKKRGLDIQAMFASKAGGSGGAMEKLEEAWRREHPGKQPTVEDYATMYQAMNKNPDPFDTFIKMAQNQNPSGANNMSEQPKEGQEWIGPDGIKRKMVGGQIFKYQE